MLIDLNWRKDFNKNHKDDPITESGLNLAACSCDAPLCNAGLSIAYDDDTGEPVAFVWWKAIPGGCQTTHWAELEVEEPRP